MSTTKTEDYGKKRIMENQRKKKMIARKAVETGVQKRNKGGIPIARNETRVTE